MKSTCFVLNTAGIYLFCLGSVCAQSKIDSFPKKPFLYIINDLKAYKQTVMEDSNNRMVLLNLYISPLITDWKYATKDNFTHTVLYHHPEAFVRLPVAKALQKVEEELKEKDLGLKFYDAYRPYNVTEQMWKIVPDERYAANPAKGSGHNRGIAVDVSLIDLKTKLELRMPTAFDDFTEKAFSNYSQLDSIQMYDRGILKNVMEKYGFSQLPTEWWHFYFATCSGDALLNLDFKTLRKVLFER